MNKFFLLGVVISGFLISSCVVVPQKHQKHAIKQQQRNDADSIVNQIKHISNRTGLRGKEAPLVKAQIFANVYHKRDKQAQHILNEYSNAYLNGFDDYLRRAAETDFNNAVDIASGDQPFSNVDDALAYYMPD